MKAAAEACGFTERTAQRRERGQAPTTSTKQVAAERDFNEYRIDDPKPYHDLSDLGKKMLARDGLPLFLREVFGWDLVPWELKAAQVSVDAILDHSQIHYGIANIAPGVGKTSFWSFALPTWLNLGGGIENPEVGRRLRFQLGHASSKISTNYVKRLARLYSSDRPFYDPQTGARGNVTLAREFGRLKPRASSGDENLWQASQFVVAQLEDVDLTDKDPTFMAVAPGMEYIGSRCEYASWDDLVTPQRSRTVESVMKDSADFQDVAERRIEPGGILWLVGQRINSYDLFRDRLDAYYLDEHQQPSQKYFHIVFPAHHESSCDGDHRQWNAEEGGLADGCLLDAKRLPWLDLLKSAQNRNFRTIMQQEDTDPASALVTHAMLEGGTGYELNPVTLNLDTVEYPGCFDTTRGWGEFPKHRHDVVRDENGRPTPVCDYVSYVTVDPSAVGNWAIEWWATRAEEDTRFLIWAHRGQMNPGDFLDWHEGRRAFIGLMERMQMASYKHHEPIRVWVIESNNAQRWLFGFRFFQEWQRRWPWVRVIPHQTMRNKNDPDFGVNALLRRKYRDGKASLPRKSGDLRALTYMNAKIKELTTFPHGGTDDTVMSDWFGELSIKEVLRVGSRSIFNKADDEGGNLAPYLLRQRREVPVVRDWRRRVS